MQILFRIFSYKFVVLGFIFSSYWSIQSVGSAEVEDNTEMLSVLNAQLQEVEVCLEQDCCNVADKAERLVVLKALKWIVNVAENCGRVCNILETESSTIDGDQLELFITSGYRMLIKDDVKTVLGMLCNVSSNESSAPMSIKIIADKISLFLFNLKHKIDRLLSGAFESEYARHLEFSKLVIKEVNDHFFNHNDSNLVYGGVSPLFLDDELASYKKVAKRKSLYRDLKMHVFIFVIVRLLVFDVTATWNLYHCGSIKCND